MTLPFLLAHVAFLFASPAPDGGEVIRQMHARYQGLWYETFTFVQDTRYMNEAGELDRTETWYETISLPGKLRIDIAPLADGRGMLFRDDVLHQISGGEIQPGRPLVHPLLVMGFDVYQQDPAVTIEKLEGLGVDLYRTYETRWDDRNVVVLGAEGPDDVRSHQLWVDRDRLLFLRQLNGPQDVRFTAYEPVGDAWVAAEVEFYSEGRLTLHEVYRDMRFDVPVEAAAFATDANTVPAWVREAGGN